MSYDPTTWQTGDIVTADKLNNIENGILGVETETSQLKSQINEVESGFPQKSASGSIVTIEDGADNVPVVSLTAQIVPVQSGSGDPAPDNVRPISGWTGANVFDTGVNVWDEEWEVGGLNSNNGANYNNAQDRIRSKNHIPVKGDTQYFLKSTASFTTICFYDSAKAFISSRGTTAADTALTMPTNAAFMRFEASSAYGTSYNHDISINYPSTDHSYHAYTGRTVNISWETEAGTVYGGSLVLNQDGTADLTVTRGFCTVDGTNTKINGTGTYATNVWAYTASQVLPSNAPRTSARGATLSNLFKAGATVDYNVAGYCYATGPTVVFTTNTEMTVEQANEWLQDTPLQVCYTLATPQTYHIENVELVKTLYGLNNIWCDTGDIDLVYRADPATYTAEQIRIMLNAMVAPVEASTTASKAYSVNEFLIMDGTLYKVIANIASGGTITINTNVSATTIGAEITNILNN